LKAADIPLLPLNVKQSLTRSAINNSFIIYCNRNKPAEN